VSAFLFEMLRHLDAGRAADVIHALSGNAHPVRVLPHIGWSEVIDEADPAYRRYGFSSTRSFETFEELMRYLSGACREMARIQELARAAGAGREDPEDWGATADTLDRTADAVREVRAQSDDFARRRELARERAAAEGDETVAGLLQAIGKVLSPWAWLPRRPGSRLVECVPSRDFHLRLRFADGLAREIELGEEFWSTTGLAPDAEEFRGVRLDRERNRLVWANGVEVPGERLHLAIIEGRLQA
jgi:hypothetical protein